VPDYGQNDRGRQHDGPSRPQRGFAGGGAAGGRGRRSDNSGSDSAARPRRVDDDRRDGAGRGRAGNDRTGSSNDRFRGERGDRGGQYRGDRSDRGADRPSGDRSGFRPQRNRSDDDRGYRGSSGSSGSNPGGSAGNRGGFDRDRGNERGGPRRGSDQWRPRSSDNNRGGDARRDRPSFRSDDDRRPVADRGRPSGSSWADRSNRQGDDRRGGGGRGYDNDRRDSGDRRDFGRERQDRFGTKPATPQWRRDDNRPGGSDRQGSDRKPDWNRSNDRSTRSDRPYADRGRPTGGRDGGAGRDNNMTGNWRDRPRSDSPRSRSDGPRGGGQTERREGFGSREGSGSSDRRYNGRPSYGDRPNSDRPARDNNRDGGRDSFRRDGDRRQDRPSFGSRDGKPSFGSRDGKPRGAGDRSSDRPSYYKPRSDRSSSDRPRYDKPRSDKPSYGRPNGDRPNSDRPNGDRPSYDKPRAERGDRPQRPDRERFRSDDRPSKRRHQHPERSDRDVASAEPADLTEVRLGTGNADDLVGTTGTSAPSVHSMARETNAGADDEAASTETEDAPQPQIQRPAGSADIDSGRAPAVPEGAEISALDPDIRAELRSLPKGLAEIVGRHLAAAGMLLDEDPEAALLHAQYARQKAARVAVVREAAGLAAYHAGEWAEALAELRAARRMSKAPGHLAVMADCERALGRPERALELAREGIQSGTLDKEDVIELRIVAAGARRDMGELDAAVVALQGDDLDPKRRDPWSARLFYAYADNLAAAGRSEEAVRWFLNAAEADDDGDTDAAEQAIELGAQLRDESPIKAELADLEAELEADQDGTDADLDEVDGSTVDGSTADSAIDAADAADRPVDDVDDVDDNAELDSPELDTVNPEVSEEPRTGEVGSAHPAG